MKNTCLMWFSQGRLGLCQSGLEIHWEPSVIPTPLFLPLCHVNFSTTHRQQKTWHNCSFFHNYKHPRAFHFWSSFIHLKLWHTNYHLLTVTQTKCAKAGIFLNKWGEKREKKRWKKEWHIQNIFQLRQLRCRTSHCVLQWQIKAWQHSFDSE